MSVLIRGMKMPTSCGTCHLRKSNEDRVWCSVIGEYICFETEFLGRMVNCPLVEVPTPHGRLIDADALKRKAQKAATEAWKMKISANVETTLNQFIDWLEDAPTIIEAEGRQ